jgi:hypothetical protein
VAYVNRGSSAASSSGSYYGVRSRAGAGSSSARYARRNTGEVFGTATATRSHRADVATNRRTISHNRSGYSSRTSSPAYRGSSHRSVTPAVSAGSHRTSTPAVSARNHRTSPSAVSSRSHRTPAVTHRSPGMTASRTHSHSTAIPGRSSSSYARRSSTAAYRNSVPGAVHSGSMNKRAVTSPSPVRRNTPVSAPAHRQHNTSPRTAATDGTGHRSTSRPTATARRK